MEKSNRYNSNGFEYDSLHSQICLADNIDFIYRKSYKGDWGHWDDLPDTTAPKLKSPASNDNKKIAKKRTADPYGNCYL